MAAAKSGRSDPRRAISPTPDRRRFTLTGPSRPIDHRIEAARRDLADIAVAGRWFAPHYAVPERRSVLPQTVLRAEPTDLSDSLAALSPGAIFEALELSGGWAWGFCADTRMVGYVRADALGSRVSLT